MLVYTATKATFLADTRANAIHEKIQRELKRSAHQGAARSQIDAWRNSMQFMASVLADDEIPGDAGVSIEYQLPLSSKRIDFILTGQSGEGPPATRQETAVIIELKQWSEAALTTKDAIVRTRLGGGEVETAHPSYQAWSYAAMIEDFNETVRHEHIALKPCAYLHNLDDGRVLNDARYAEHTARAPVFISSDAQRLADFLKQHVRYGDSRDIMYRIEHDRIRPSKSLADRLASMLKGHRELALGTDYASTRNCAAKLLLRLGLVYRAKDGNIENKNLYRQILLPHVGPSLPG